MLHISFSFSLSPPYLPLPLSHTHTHTLHTVTAPYPVHTTPTDTTIYMYMPKVILGEQHSTDSRHSIVVNSQHNPPLLTMCIYGQKKSEAGNRITNSNNVCTIQASECHAYCTYG